LDRTPIHFPGAFSVPRGLALPVIVIGRSGRRVPGRVDWSHDESTEPGPLVRGESADPGRRVAVRPTLVELIQAAEAGILLFGLTPPRLTAGPQRMAEIAAVTTARLSGIDIDGLVLYDIDDESDRNSEDRPFPYLPTADPADFYARYLTQWPRPVVIYRCVGKYEERNLADWLTSIDSGDVLGVFVGASSTSKQMLTDLPRAHALHQQLRPELTLGAVTITERHTVRTDEHLRMLAKQDRGCAFFVSQVVYDMDATKSLLSDYAYTCAERGVRPRPVIFTLAVCGSLKTLEFLQWLGVVVPRWVENDLRHADDPLTVSAEQCLRTARELLGFGRRLGVPVGFNVESVSNRRSEIEAAVGLAVELRTMLDQAAPS
jgi:hypothetical protein